MKKAFVTGIAMATVMATLFAAGCGKKEEPAPAPVPSVDQGGINPDGNIIMETGKAAEETEPVNDYVAPTSLTQTIVGDVIVRIPDYDSGNYFIYDGIANYIPNGRDYPSVGFTVAGDLPDTEIPDSLEACKSVIDTAGEAVVSKEVSNGYIVVVPATTNANDGSSGKAATAMFVPKSAGYAYYVVLYNWGMPQTGNEKAAYMDYVGKIAEKWGSDCTITDSEYDTICASIGYGSSGMSVPSDNAGLDGGENAEPEGGVMSLDGVR